MSVRSWASNGFTPASALYEAGEVEKKHRQHRQDLGAGRMSALEIMISIWATKVWLRVAIAYCSIWGHEEIFNAQSEVWRIKRGAYPWTLLDPCMNSGAVHARHN